MTNIRREKSHTFQRAFRMTSWLSPCGVLQSSGIPWLFFLSIFWKEKMFVVCPVSLNTNFTMLKVKGQWFVLFFCSFRFVAFSGSRVWNGNWAPYCLVRRNPKDWGKTKVEIRLWDPAGIDHHRIEGQQNPGSSHEKLLHHPWRIHVTSPVYLPTNFRQKSTIHVGKNIINPMGIRHGFDILIYTGLKVQGCNQFVGWKLGPTFLKGDCCFFEWIICGPEYSDIDIDIVTMYMYIASCVKLDMWFLWALSTSYLQAVCKKQFGKLGIGSWVLFVLIISWMTWLMHRKNEPKKNEHKMEDGQRMAKGLCGYAKIFENHPWDWYMYIIFINI